MLEEPSISCPYCGEIITVVVDTTIGNQRYVEDCFVCCQPIVLSLTIDGNGQIESIEAEPENA